MSNIEWTEETWNPIAGCSVVSPGCTNCYAMKLAGTRLDKHPKYRGLTQQTKAGPVWTGETRFDAEALLIPLRKKKPTRYFVNSMSDLFAESVPDEWIDQIFAVMALCPQHEFQVLTKRAERMRGYFAKAVGRSGLMMTTKRDNGFNIEREMRIREATSPLGSFVGRCDDPISFPLPNVWLGVSVEDQKRAVDRIPELLSTPAAVRFLSCEPLLAPLDLRCLDLDGHREVFPLEGTTECEDDDGNPMADMPSLDWIIVGGESGPDRRMMDPAWARAIRDHCTSAGVPFFMKQMTGKIAIPADLMIREWPKPTTKRGPSAKPVAVSQLDLLARPNDEGTTTPSPSTMRIEQSDQ
jgi:protein gp37